MPTARLILDAPAAGDWNMAVDEALLMSAGQVGQVTLRFYGWQAPTLSLGYFQPHAQRDSHAASRACPVVRRGTGGGAIVHDRELTYSFVAPIDDRLSADVEQLYYAFHETLLAALATWGVLAELCVTPTKLTRDAEPFLCFQRRSAGDVLLRTHKIGGSAQRRHYGAVLQHGSVLLAQSQAAPELPGIREIADTNPTALDLISLGRPRLAERLDLTLAEGVLSPAELAQSQALLGQRFANRDWTLKR